MSSISNVLRLGENIVMLPIIHGSGECALAVRNIMLDHSFDCVAVPLPMSFQQDVEQAITWLPTPTVVTQAESAWSGRDVWSDGEDDESLAEEDGRVSFVPIDPCQGVIMALRVALGEHLAREFIDLETSEFEPWSDVLPDPYALKRVSVEQFAAATMPAIARPPAGQPEQRVRHMAFRLRELQSRYRSILFVCSLLEWPWIRQAFTQSLPCETEHDMVETTSVYEPDPRTLTFMFGELPFVTGLYERARSELEDDTNLTIDGVKELLISARDHYRKDLGRRSRDITPALLASCLKYVRNLSLIERRMSPDLYTLVVAAKQVIGDQYALHVAQTARLYPYDQETGFPRVTLGIDQARMADGDMVSMINRLPGPPIVWRSCELNRRPSRDEMNRWQMQWNPFGQCSWPPEDDLIENFRNHVFDRARDIMGADLARSEKFSTSVMDGIDIRETLRNWHSGDIYVKILPPSRGDLNCAVMLFDSPADPRDYPWRTTWFAEHNEESTLAFYATDFRQEMVGPGIGLGTYGGAMFLFPPRSIPDIWHDDRLDFTETLEERLLAAACIYSQSPQIALLSPAPPGAGWRRLARRFHKRWIHVPLGQFSQATVQQLRMVHVLNGHQVRSFAAHFIRRA
ncbi:MAG: hypothetical protein MK179_11590 [Pirellulaceae bacterium]|nr:hypothetical protein [Pirellulaceae bacterium]